MNVSSIVVKTRPEHLNEVLNSLEASDLCDVHFHDEHGRIVITIEGKDVNEEVRKLGVIQKIAHVLAAELIYAYSDEELERSKEHFDKMRSAIPDALKD